MILYYLLDGRPPWPFVNGAVAVRKAAINGDRPVIPRKWDQRLSNLIQECWDENANHCPSFQKIIEVLDDFMKTKFHIDENGPAAPELRPPRELSMHQMFVDKKCQCIIL
jgi:hypothetical protein